MLRISLSGPPNRRIQPERYATFLEIIVKYIDKKIKRLYNQEKGDRMNKHTIRELLNYSHYKIVHFAEYYKNENLLDSSFSNWNVRDVIGHINKWMYFSKNKLKAVKGNPPSGEINCINIQEFNKMNYEQNKNSTLENILSETKTILKDYNDILNLFTDEELPPPPHVPRLFI
jgi:hypothetical protein